MRETYIRGQNDYAPYEAHVQNTALSRLLGSLTVRNVSAFYWECAPDWKMAPRRIGDDMFFCIVRGSGSAHVEEHCFDLKPGICAHFRRGSWHGATTEARDPMEVITLQYTATVWNLLPLPDVLQFPDCFDLSAQPRWSEGLLEACREYAVRPAGWEREVQAITVRFLLSLLRDSSEMRQVDWRFDTHHSLALNDLKRLLPALEAMRHSLGAPLPISLLARECGFSPAQFRRVFRRTLGASPIEYLRRRRIEEACLLLRQTNDTIETIATRVGYADASFFTHSFRRMMGTSPGQYRARIL